MKRKVDKIIALVIACIMVFSLMPRSMNHVIASTTETASMTDATEAVTVDADDSEIENVSPTEDKEKDTEDEISDDSDVNSDTEDGQEPEEDTEEDTEEEMEEEVAFDSSVTLDGVTVKVSADKGVFPEGSTLSVKKVTDDQAADAGVTKAVDEERDDDVNVAASMTFDIKVLDKEGNEIEPDNTKGEVRVTFSHPLIADSNLDTNVYHIKDDAGAKDAEKLDTDEKGNTAEVTTDGFSYYTVEFTYDGLQYVMEGDTALPLSTILDFVGLTGTVEDAYGSNDELFRVMKGVQEGREWVESEDGEWIVKAEKAFSSNETLTVTINGVEYVIDVTDAQYDTDYNKTAQTLVNAVLGDGLTATNCSRTGSINTFTGGESDIGFASGIILSSAGNVSGGTDPDLAALVAANGQQYGNGTEANTSTLEFTLTATGTLLNFNYVFASNEFDQGPTFNDAFGLFVSVNGGAYENIALIERTNGTLVPVTINNLRAGINGTEMSNGQSTSLGGSHSLFYEKNISINSGSTNGVSIVFNAQKVVQKGDTVKIKFAICNVGDNSVPSYVMIQASSLKFDTPGSKPNYLTETLYDLEPNTNYEIEENGVKYNLTTDSEGKVPLSGKDNNNKSYDFIGKTISITMLDSSGQVASETQDLGIAERPAAPDDPEAPEIDIAEKPADVHDIEIETTDTTITVHGPQENEYKLDEGPWTKPTNGVVVFDNLTPNHEYTVYTRVAATENHPYGETSEGERIRTNAVDLEINIMNYQGVYDGAYHGASVTTPVQGVEITWSDEFQTNYSETKPTFKDVGTYTVYYRVVKENCYPAYGALTVNIIRAPVTVKADDKNKVRGEQDPPFTATVTGVLEGESADDLISYTLSRASGSDAGTYTITPSGATNQGNYAVTYQTGTLTIAANPNSGSVSMEGWTYGKESKNPSVTAEHGPDTATFEYFTNAACTTKTSAADGATAAGGKPSNAGTYYVVATIPATTNYQGVVTEPAEFTISPAQITITADDKTSVYGDSLKAFTSAVTGDYKSGDDLGITYSSQVTVTPDVGQYDINVSWNNNPNYTATLVKGTYTVTTRTITITAAAKQKTYGEVDPALTYTVSGLADGDTTSVITGSLAREEGEVVGTYPITQGTISAGNNYTVSYTGANLTINVKPLTISTASDEKVYDGTALKNESYTNTDLADGDKIESVTFTGSQTVFGSSDNTVGAVVIMKGDKDVTSSYSISYNCGTLTVNKKALTITAKDATKTYDSTALMSDAYEATELGDGDNIDSVTFEGSQTDVGSSDNEPKAAVIMKGNDVVTGCYEITFVKGTLEVTKATITVDGITAEDKQYDATTDATLDFSGAVLDGKCGDDDVSVTAKGTFCDKNVGEDKTVNISDLELIGDKAGNYELAATGNQETTTASITDKVEVIQNPDGTTTTITTTTDEDGNEVVTEKKEKDGKVIEEKETHYDEDGNVTKETITTHNDDGTTTVKETENHDDGTSTETVTEKDKDGNVTKETVTEKDKDGNPTHITETEIERDEDGNVTKETVTEKDGDGNVTKETETTHNDDGTTTEKETVYHDDGTSTETVTEKDKDGNTTKETVTEKDKDGKVTKETETTHNDDGTTTEKETVYHDDGTSTETITEKDENGNTTKETVTEKDKDGRITKETETQYDEDGNVTQVTETTTSEDGKTRTTVVRDGEGNIIDTYEEEVSPDSNASKFVKKIGDAPDTTMDNPVNELAEMLLDDEEKDEMKAGSRVSMYLTIEDISETVDSQDKAKVEAVVAGAGLIKYFDVNLYKKIGTAKEFKITETSGMINITLQIPDELINTDPSIERSYVFVRLHEGTAEILPTTIDLASKTISFSTNRFSIYAIVCIDKTTGSKTDAKAEVSKKTDDSTPLFPIIFMFVMSAAGSVFVARKRSMIL